jgi:hypothetical protein
VTPASRSRPTLAETAKGTAWMLALWAAMQAAAAVLVRSAIAAVGVQAALAEWGCERLGVTWSDPLAAAPTGADLRRRVGIGVGLGLSAAGAVAVVALASHPAVIAPAAPDVGALLLGLLVAALTAVRDELLLRGAVLRFSGRYVGTAGAMLACAAASAAARSGAMDPSATAIAAEALRGLALASLWVRDRGAWMPVAANTAWTWCLDSLASGDLVDVRFAGELGASLQAIAVLAACSMLSWASLARRPA